MALISAMGAPEWTSVLYVAMRSASEISSSIGFSTMDDPPPEIMKMTSEAASSARKDLRIASAARMDSVVGVGCPPWK